MHVHLAAISTILLPTLLQVAACLAASHLLAGVAAAEAGPQEGAVQGTHPASRCGCRGCS